jgi:hypothetical protein
MVNAERKKQQAGPVSYEVFEIIMDKLEKEYFDLVCDRLPLDSSFAIDCPTARTNCSRSSEYLSQHPIYRSRIPSVPSVMTERERTPMLSSFVTAVTLLSIKVSIQL